MSVFHVKHPTPKHVENSIRGIRTAKRRGYSEIDLDMLITTEGRIVGCHWPRPMAKDGFRDPYGELNKNRTVASMTFHEVTRLVAGKWPRRYRIQPIERLLRECAKQGVGAVLEPKGDRRFEEPKYWIHLAQVADDCGAHVRVYGFQRRALNAAAGVGFRVRELKK